MARLFINFSLYVTEDERMEYLAVLLREAKLVEVTVHIGDCRDPQDNEFLESAVNGEAAWIVSGDKDLLVLHPFSGYSGGHATQLSGRSVERVIVRALGQTDAGRYLVVFFIRPTEGPFWLEYVTRLAEVPGRAGRGSL